MSRVTVSQAVYRLRRVPPRRLPVVVGRYALQVARARARRWRMRRQRGELSDAALQRALAGVPPEAAFGAFLRRFFVDPDRARATVAALAHAYPQHAQRSRDQAEHALRHVIDLLGSGPTQLDARINWQQDFKTGFSWSRQLLPDDQDTLRLDDPCDIKVPWELSRCHHWVALGRAYALDADSRYAAEFARELDAWLQDNPWPYGVNWSRSMEVAVRAVNWMWAAALFAEAPEFTPMLRRRFLKAMVQHGNQILNNLEYTDNNGNHYLSNGVGLLFVGVLFAELAPAAAWRKKGAEIVWGEIQRQVHPDGVDFEQGIGYHGLVTEFWYSCVLLCERNAIAVPAHVRPRLQRMFDFMLAYTRPDGTFPQIGDNDDGRLAGIDDEPVGSHCRHLAVGGVLFDRDDLFGAAGDAIETVAWLCGPRALDQSRSTPTPVSQAFPDGGFYLMRSADTSMVVDAAEVGMRGIGGHGHADVLAFDLWAAGAGVLVDSGTYTYSADAVLRQALRGTAAHNSLCVDGQDSSRLGTGRWLWLIENDARPCDVTWQSDTESDVFVGSHTGYRRLPEAVTHTRGIHFDKTRCIWRIDDAVEGAGVHLVEVFFHPGVPFELDDDGVRLRAPRGDVILLPPGGTALSQQPGWISRGYGLREPATVLAFATHASVPIRLTSHLVLVPSGTPVSTARCLVDMDAR
ncbi:MAG: alginate lyase family protein [Chloroflexi bacterium]|nr:alginate lyase family protein [Chloroflexota bacterium]